jgi:tRNA G10  N-methylase Trm11
MKYFFQLGSNKLLSTAEIFAIFKGYEAKMRLLNDNILLLDTEQEIDIQEKIQKMGGIIKIGIVQDEINVKTSIDEIIKKIISYFKLNDKKLKYGISYYGKIVVNPKRLGMTLKNKLKERGANARWVAGKEKILSSVIVEQNKLIENGAEINLISDGSKILLAQTLAVQPFKELSFRDYGRPARDDESGMLPPKLAMIMLNLAQAKKDDIILDPFCGSGTIITEAMNQAYQNLIATDKSDKAVLDTKRNIEWMRRKIDLDIQTNVFQADATKLSGLKEINKITKIITEPYLGPQRGIRDFHKIKKELNIFYSKVILEFSKIINQNGRVVMIWPIFLDHGKKIFLDPELSGFKIKRLISEEVLKENNLKLSFRNTIYYGREGQRVWREILVLNK